VILRTNGIGVMVIIISVRGPSHRWWSLSDLHSRMSPTVVVDGVGFVEFAVPSVGVVYHLNCSLEMELIEVVRFHFDSNHDHCYTQ
jgi:hypothetical protein